MRKCGSGSRPELHESSPVSRSRDTTRDRPAELGVHSGGTPSAGPPRHRTPTFFPVARPRLWTRGGTAPELPEFGPTTEELREYADRLRGPYCGPEAGAESRAWFQDADAQKSFAHLPLRTTTTFGMLALASDDVNRFHAGMGTVFLLRLAELASVAIARFLPAA